MRPDCCLARVSKLGLFDPSELGNSAVVLCVDEPPFQGLVN